MAGAGALISGSGGTPLYGINTEKLLRELIDGTNPLPQPHPQKLTFTKNEDAIKRLAIVTERIVRSGGYIFGKDEVRHLLFKLAAWCSKKGASTGDDVEKEINRIWLPVDMALTANPNWLKGRAGVAYTVRQYRQWRSFAERQGRANAVDPLRVAELDFLHAHFRCYHLVELTTAAHVHAEGQAMGHCMSWSVNVTALAKYGYPAEDDPKVLECLTYAIKLRSGELRLFSVRSNRTDKPRMTIAYNVKHKRILTMELAPDYTDCQRELWSQMKCAAVHALVRIVPVDSLAADAGCRDLCPRNGWCKSLEFSYDVRRWRN